ncbi:MAG TPA: Ig domain-containing protein, partial [Terracidiphilus sp.]|nr:Ig domain-containing protein [Terracidiphilus sp.]
MAYSAQKSAPLPSSFAALVLFAVSCLVAACGSGSSTPPPPALVITTASLTDGQVGVAYTATLAASGGTAPYTWSVASGTLPAGIALNDATGAISGTPTAKADAALLTFAVTDSGSPAQKQSVALHLTIRQAVPPVSISPVRGAVVINQSIALTANAGDGNTVAWSVTGVGCSGPTCGTFSSSTTGNGVAVTYAAPAAPGVYTVTATNTADSTKSASVSVAVTDLAGVTTYHNDLARDGANTREYALTPAAVASSHFGKLFSCAVDGAVYAQPLWMPSLPIGGSAHNVVFIATQHDSLYAFDADSTAGHCTPLWHANLIDASHGAGAGETTVPSSGPGALVGAGFGDIAPEVGITGTPVLDPATHILYVVSKSVIPGSLKFFQRLHAIDAFTGKEKLSGPVTISGSFPGTADGGSMTTFQAGQQNQRAGLALVNGLLYIAWSAHEDKAPY